MSTTQYVAQLTEKHHRIEEEIHKQMMHPSTDHVHITELKREKLRLKEKIAELNGDLN
ncbi:YdcH family protein [Sneathiella chinensis]|uniref:DUF465 domain-containing protein n=1 Tax=Sneathiella chinensis TaxID=349750 RepID=A0ABQ5U2Y0_9PROT|nr:DUF465 domain-containing protein [Sneathiella chinensis]GLQ06525.1 hypothetical protein GCM10007924_17460 [Sneathiella chinensis]